MSRSPPPRLRSQLAAAARFPRLLSAAYGRFNRDGADLLAASLAFHTLLSIAPLVLVSVAVAGLILGQQAAREQATRLLTETMGPQVADTVDGWVVQAAASGALASAVGLALVVWAASRLGNVLLAALNRVFGRAQVEARLKAQVAAYLRRRLLSAALVLATGPLLLTVVASRALLTAFHRFLFGGSPWAGAAVQASQVFLSLWVVAGSCALLYGLLPSQRVPWRVAVAGGALTSVLFNAGNALVGLYLASASVGAVYGLAGSAVAVLIWLQFSTTVFLFGAEFARACAEEKEADRTRAPGT